MDKGTVLTGTRTRNGEVEFFYTVQLTKKQYKEFKHDWSFTGATNKWENVLKKFDNAGIKIEVVE